MINKKLDNELKFLELSVAELLNIVKIRREAHEDSYKVLQCTDSDIIRMCDNIRKSSLTIKNHAHLMGR